MFQLKVSEFQYRNAHAKYCYVVSQPYSFELILTFRKHEMNFQVFFFIFLLINPFHGILSIDELSDDFCHDFQNESTWNIMTHKRKSKKVQNIKHQKETLKKLSKKLVQVQQIKPLELKHPKLLKIQLKNLLLFLIVILVCFIFVLNIHCYCC